MAYNIKLSQFEGPLDLLLHLISKAKISIEEIFVSEVTEQYLLYMEQLNDEAMDKKSEFLSMASTLLYIKSRALLPVKASFDDEEVDPEQELLEKLRIYKIYKDACENLRRLENEADEVYFKLPEELPDLVSPVIWEDTEITALYEAYFKVLADRKARKPLYETVSVKKDNYSIRVQTEKILNLVSGSKRIGFSEIFNDAHHPMEIAVTFVALLQLWHDKRIAVSQEGHFNEIYFSCYSEEKVC